MSVKHCVVRTDKMFGTYNVAGLANVKISEELDNGSIVVIGALAEGEREAYVAEMPATDSALATLGLIAAPEDFEALANTFSPDKAEAKHRICVTKEALDDFASSLTLSAALLADRFKA